MQLKRGFVAFISVRCFASAAAAQRTEITVTFGEQFFDSLLDAVFANSAPQEFSLARNDTYDARTPVVSGFAEERERFQPKAPCSETIKLLRENRSVRTAVRFKDGKIVAPIAFTGNYSPPLVGCVQFSGWAESVIDLQFDPQTRVLVGRAKILNVSLDGTGGIGGSVIAKLVQSSIDKKINPIEILNVGRIVFPLPIQNAGNLRMQAVGIRQEVVGNALNVHVQFEFVK
jgi:hypothetical protein